MRPALDYIGSDATIIDSEGQLPSQPHSDRIAAGRDKRLDDISIAKAYAAPLLLATMMAAIAVSLAGISNVWPRDLFEPYLSGWAAATFQVLTIWAIIEVGRMAINKVDRPAQEIVRRIVAKLPLFALPGLIFPLFLGCYTWAKSSIPYIVGFGWDGFWTAADHLILRHDAWQLAHAVMPTVAGPYWSFFYAMIWGASLVFGGAMIYAFGSRRKTATFFTSLMMAWMIGGIGMAYLMSAGGPTFAYMTDPSLAGRFEPLKHALLAVLGPDDTVVKTQRYLAMSIHTHWAIKGGGISAMPSMHIATATTFLLACWNNKWLRAVAALFVAMTFFGSIYLGYHYAVDAPVAATIACLCWWASSRWYASAPSAAEPAATMEPAPSVA